MKPKEIRELTTEEITQRILDNKKDVQHLRFQNAVAGLEDPASFRAKQAPSPPAAPVTAAALLSFVVTVPSP